MQRFQEYARKSGKHSDKIAPSATITVYINNSSGLATIYDDNSFTAKANPFTADSTTGLFHFYAADGRYDVKISGTNVDNSYTWGDVLLNSGGVQSQIVWAQADAGAKGDGTTNDYGALNTAVNTTLASGGTLAFEAGTYLVGTNLEFDSGINLVFLEGAKIKPAAGVTLTFSGTIDAPLSQIFDDTNDETWVVSKGMNGYVYPQWWGATGAGSPTDDVEAFKKAWAQAVPMFIPKGNYYLSESWDTRAWNSTSQGKLARGAGRNKTQIHFNGTNGIFIDNEHTVLEQFSVINLEGGAISTSPGSATRGDITSDLYGVGIDRSYCMLDSIEIAGFGVGLWYKKRYYNTARNMFIHTNLVGVRVGNDGFSINFNRIEDSYISYNYENNIEALTGNGFHFVRCSMEICDDNDVDFANYPHGGALIEAEDTVFDGCWFETLNIVADAENIKFLNVGNLRPIAAAAPIFLDSYGPRGYTTPNLAPTAFSELYSGGANTSIDTDVANVTGGHRYAIVTSTRGAGVSKYISGPYVNLYGVLPQTGGNFYYYGGCWIKKSSVNHDIHVLIEFEDEDGNTQEESSTRMGEDALVDQTSTAWQYIGGLNFLRTTWFVGKNLKRCRLRVRYGLSGDDFSAPATPAVFWMAEPDLRIYSMNINHPTLMLTGDAISMTRDDQTILGQITLKEKEVLSGNVGDGYASGLVLAPRYDAAVARTVTRHNYLHLQDPELSGAGPAAVTNAAVMRFDDGIGTHKALAAGFNTTDSGAQTTAWAGGIIVNVNGTLYKIPIIAL